MIAASRAEEGHPDVIELLIQAGASKDAQCKVTI
jgi:hypothetical protein